MAKKAGAEKETGRINEGYVPSDYKRIQAALREAQKEAKENPIRYDFDEVASRLRKKLVASVEGPGA